MTQEATALLHRAFSKSISSADLKMDAELDSARGLPGLDGPFRLDASGPFQSGGRQAAHAATSM